MGRALRTALIMTMIHVNAAALRDILASAAMATEKPLPARVSQDRHHVPILGYVRLEFATGELTATATDRFRLVQAVAPTVLPEGFTQYEPDGWTILVPAKEAALIAKTIGTRPGKDDIARLEVTDNVLVVQLSTGPVAVASDVPPTGYPRVDSLISSSRTNPQPTESIRLDLRYLAMLSKLPHNPTHPPLLVFKGDRGPVRAEWEYQDVRYLFLLMPRR